MVGRPKGTGGKYKKRNDLKYQEIVNVIKDYSKLSNSHICKKYNISKGQLRKIRIDYNLGHKSLTKFIGCKSSITDLIGVCGLYAIVRIDVRKAYVGSSIDIGNRLKNHLYTLNNNSHYNSQLQQDWKDYPFFFTLITRLEEDQLLLEENKIILELNEGSLYNKNKILVEDLCNNRLCCNPEHLKENDHTLKRSKLYPYREEIWNLYQYTTMTFKEIKDHLNLTIAQPTLWNFWNRMKNKRGDFREDLKPSKPLKHPKKSPSPPREIQYIRCEPYLNLVQTLREQGKSCQTIADALPIDISGSSVKIFCGKNGIESPFSERSALAKYREEIYRLWSIEKWSFEDIAAEFSEKLSGDMIANYLSAMGEVF